MLKISTHQDSHSITLKLEGRVAGEWVRELDRCYRAFAAMPHGKGILIDLTGVTFIDAEGKTLLAAMHRQGARLLACGVMTRAIVEEIARAKTVLALVVLWILAGSQSAQAQEKAPVRLTLREAIQVALKQNPQVQIANLNVAQSEEDRTSARAALLPQASFQMFERSQRGNIEAFFGRRIPGIPQHIGPFEVFQTGPGFSAPVFDLTLWRRLQASREAVKAAGAQQQTVREQNVLLVVSQYLGSLRAAASVKSAQSRVELAEALYELAADLQKYGVGTGIDTLRANVQLQNEKQRLIVAETQRKTALYGLVRLLNLELMQSLELADEMSFFETPEFGADQTLELALKTRPEIQALSSREQIASIQRRAAGELRLPSVRVDGFWNYQGRSATAVIPAYQYQATAQFPLFTGGRIGAERARADLELRKIEQERQELRNGIALEVKTAIAELDSGRNEVEVANLAVKLAREEVEQARDRFQAGVANNIEVISAQDGLTRASENQIAALYRYNQARANLAHATGQMESLYAK